MDKRAGIVAPYFLTQHPNGTGELNNNTSYWLKILAPLRDFTMKLVP